MFNRVIPWRSQAKYLGVIVDKRLSFIPHIDYIVANTNKIKGSLSALIGRRSKLSIRNKLLLYRTIIRPTMSYASVAWSYQPSKSQFHRLEVIQTKTLRQVFKAPWFVRNAQLLREASLPPLKEFLHEIALRSFRKAEEHPNPLVREAVDYEFDEEAPPSRKRPRRALLEDQIGK